MLECHGAPDAVLRDMVEAMEHPVVVCEQITAPEEQALVQRLRDHGVSVITVWQSSLLSLSDLPFKPSAVPDTFTSFRRAVEDRQVEASMPLSAPCSLPALPDLGVLRGIGQASDLKQTSGLPDCPPATSISKLGSIGSMRGSETDALRHLQQYCQRGLPHTYKSTRNALMGVDSSSKWSLWLAHGALSARKAWASIREFERAEGATESTYWLWFELLWRDHFRLLHHKHGSRLYHAGGLTGLPCTSHDETAFQLWCVGRTGHDLIDAGMRELAMTGYLSNRMRQIVASYLIHDLGCDWRAGAAWFESQLIDLDVYSNQGNWLYVSGHGTDPRGGRRFNPDKQADEHDPLGEYRRIWLNEALLAGPPSTLGAPG